MEITSSGQFRKRKGAGGPSLIIPGFMKAGSAGTPVIVNTVGGQTKGGRTWYTNAAPGRMRICVGGPWGKNCQKGYVDRSGFAKRRKGYNRRTHAGSSYCAKYQGGTKVIKMDKNGRLRTVNVGRTCLTKATRTKSSIGRRYFG